MTIKIVTDSSIQLTTAEQERYDIHIVPLTIQQGAESFVDGQTITRAEFLSRLQNATTEFPTTSQPTVGSFVELYDQLGADGSTILSIHCTGLLSGTIEGAHTAAQQSTSDVHVIDSKEIDRGLAYQVVAAAQDVEAGKTLTEIIAHLDEIRSKTETYVFLDSLDALQRGGRISRMAGLLTKLIKLKVIVRLTDTELEVIQAYDVWKEKKNYGKVSMGVVRTTYLIDEEGVIIQANDKVKAAEDPEKMLAEIS